jgi:DNA-binding NarL/FixJ family response regulator
MSEVVNLFESHASIPAQQTEADIFATLTPTQMKVMNGVYLGQLNKQIAYELGIAEATVKAHMTALMRKLNVRNRTQVAIAARQAR